MCPRTDLNVLGWALPRLTAPLWGSDKQGSSMSVSAITKDCKTWNLGHLEYRTNTGTSCPFGRRLSLRCCTNALNLQVPIVRRLIFASAGGRKQRRQGFSGKRKRIMHELNQTTDASKICEVVVPVIPSTTVGNPHYSVRPLSDGPHCMESLPAPWSRPWTGGGVPPECDS